MQFTFEKKAWNTIEVGEKNCYILTNGLGGYHSLSVIGAAARADQAFFMAAKKAPNVRWHMITNLVETLSIDGQEYTLTSQRMKESEDLSGYRYLTSFSYDNMPKWTYEVEDVTVEKEIVMVHGENTVAVRYTMQQKNDRNVKMEVKPLIRYTAKNTAFTEEHGKKIKLVKSTIVNQNTKEMQTQYGITDEDSVIYFATNGNVTEMEPSTFGVMYFSQDERDGRDFEGSALYNHVISCEGKICEQELVCVYSMNPYAYQSDLFEKLVQEQREYLDNLLNKAPLKSELGKQLVLSADAYVVNRDSTKGKSIIAGYPFFEDWGRDTMISLPGITMITGRFEECKSILRTFAKYINNGLLPNLFPEGDENPMYNSADAPLLFVNTVYEYLEYSKDEEFLEEIYPALEQVVAAYERGTDFHIKMDSDGLIQAGAGLEQLTWMDVRVGEHLPTPRHGKPVEINAYWYSALKVMAELSKNISGKKEKTCDEYEALAEKVKNSFWEKFWNEEENCLKDVLSGNYEENQVRCNQIWALTQPFTMLDREHEEKVIKKVRDELYTTIGLRTLSPKDSAFHKVYIGPMEERDRAYHQGTVWGFPLGAYYRACIRFMEKYDFAEKKEWTNHICDGLKALEEWLVEGCISQVAEIYDGECPTVSRGCYAQAWSVGELLRAVYDFEQMQG